MLVGFLFSGACDLTQQNLTFGCYDLQYISIHNLIFTWKGLNKNSVSLSITHEGATQYHSVVSVTLGL